MKKALFFAAALAVGTTPLLAQPPMDPKAVAPMTGLSASDYVMKAADGDMFEIESSRVALQKSKRKDVRTFAQRMIKDHTMTTQSLKAALKKDGNTMSPPASMTADKQSKVDMLKSASDADFDRMYVDQQNMAHMEALGVHKGYAMDGSDAALKANAKKAVPIIERHLTTAHSLGNMNGGAM